MNNLTPEQRLLFTLLIGSKPYVELEKKFGADTCANALKTNLMVKSFFGDTQITQKGLDEVNKNSIKAAPKPLKPVIVQTTKTVKPLKTRAAKPPKPTPKPPPTPAQKRATPKKWIFTLEMERYLIATIPNQNRTQRAESTRHLSNIWNFPVLVIQRKIHRMNHNLLTRRPWTQKEERQLVKFYKPELGYRVLTEKLNRSADSIRHKLEELGCLETTPVAPKWTDSELQYLKNNAPTQTAIAMSEHLPGRTINAINSKCFELRLPRNQSQP